MRTTDGRTPHAGGKIKTRAGKPRGACASRSLSAGSFNELLAALVEAAKSYGHYNTLRESSQDTVDYWRDRTTEIHARLTGAHSEQEG